MKGGLTKLYGSKSSKIKVHLKYDAKEEHYYCADSSGEKCSTQPKNSQPGNCFFEAIAHSLRADPVILRQEVADFILRNSGKLNELRTGEIVLEEVEVISLSIQLKYKRQLWQFGRTIPLIVLMSLYNL